MLRKILTGMILLVPLMILFPGFTQFLYPAGSSYSDLTISHYPNLLFLQKSLVETKEIPLWADTILGGYPFAANPLSGIYYPMTWLILFLPQPFGFTFSVILHLFFGGLGVFFLLRKMKAGFFPALIGAVIFELMPKMFAHFASGHVTLLYAVCFTPWLVYSEMSRQESHRWSFGVLPGIIIGMIALADVRWLPYAILIWGLQVLNYEFRTFFAAIAGVRSSFQIVFETIKRIFKSYLLQGLIALGIAAPLVLMLAEFTQYSTRSLLEETDRLFLSLSPVRLLGMLLPDMAAYSEWVIFPGALAVILMVAGISNRNIFKKIAVWAIFLAISIFLALGSNNPLMPMLSNLPGFSYLRVPTRALFLAGFSFSITAGLVLDEFLPIEEQKQIKLLPVFACALTVMGLVLGQYLISREFSLEFFWGAVFFLFYTVLLCTLNNIIGSKRNSLFTLILVLCVFELGLVDYSQFNPRDRDEVNTEGDKTAALIASYDDVFRVYSPSFSIPQLTAVRYGLELADGIDPMQLKNYVVFMEEASGVQNDGYSVTLPALKNGKPETDNRDAIPDASLLGLLNVRFICAEYDIHADHIRLLDSVGNTRVYENMLVRPRAWLQETTDLYGENYSPVQLLAREPNSIELTAEGPGVVVLSEIYYPGWRVTIDGSPASLIEIGGLLRGVEIKPGMHFIEFSFAPVLHTIGLLIALITWIALGIYFIMHRKIDRKNET